MGADWTALHWLLVLVFFGMLATCGVVVIRLPPLRIAGMAPHDLANRFQNLASEAEQRVRHLPTPREMRELAARMQAMEQGVMQLATAAQATRDGMGRIERDVRMVMQVLLDREKKEGST